jgi:thiamine-monophosphate kinase
MPRRAPAAAFSERRFHAWLRQGHRRTRGVPLPLGDDAAALRWSGHRVALLTTDALVEGTHFLPTSPPKDIGRAAAAVSLSDIAAKGGRPLALLLDLLLPPDDSAAWAERVTQGAREEMRRWGADLVGGDTKPGASRAVVSTVLGDGDDRRLVPRSGARPDDVLIHTGTVGRGGAAADRLGRGRPDGATLRALLTVEPRLFEGRVLARSAHAMLDTSDGIAEAARLLAEASHARVILDWEFLPLADGLARIPPGSRREAAVFFGGDYELLAAVPAARAPVALRAVERVGGRATVVGAVTRGRGAWLRRGGALTPLPAGGWDPFAWALSRARPSHPPS